MKTRLGNGVPASASLDEPRTIQGREVRLRLAVLLIAGALVAALVGSNMLLSRRLENSSALRADMEQVVATVAGEAVANTTAHLQPAEGTAAVLAGRLAQFETGASSAEEWTDELLASFHRHLTVHESYDGIFMGRPDGSFVYLRKANLDDIARSGTNAEFIIKVISVVDETRTVEELWADGNLSILDRTIREGDSYDPRQRTWYEDAMAQNGPTWTSPYLFFTTGLPGVTHSVPVIARDGTNVGVLGIDTKVEDLSAFMANRQVSPNGVSFILTRAGQVVAYPDLQNLMVGRGEVAQVTDVADERVGFAYAAILAGTVPAGTVGTVSSPESEAFQVAVSQLAANPDWYVAVVTPEADFLANSRSKTADMARVVVVASLALVALLLMLLVWVLRTVKMLHTQASTDDLTALASRAEVLAGLDGLLRPGSDSISVVLIDLDNFKSVNDEHGHAVGDLVLQVVGERISGSVAKSDLVGRLGGDEFVVVLRDVDTLPEAKAVAQRLHDALCVPVATPNALLPLTASIGVSISQPGWDRGELLHSADVALYSAKDAGRNQVRAFDVVMDRTALEEKEWSEQLELAVSQRMFDLRFQPEVDLLTGEICGAEALLRWDVPGRGTLEAKEFIERLDVLEALSSLLSDVVHETVLVGRAMSVNGRLPTMRINLTRQQLLSDELLEALDELQPADIQMLVLEVRERDVYQISSELTERLKVLHQRSIRLAIDDFGTGGRSLTALGIIAMSELRMHPAIVQSLRPDTIAHSTATVVGGIAKSMRLGLSAVGIETVEQRELLLGMGCRWGQGYLFSPAVTSEELLAMQGFGALPLAQDSRTVPHQQ